MSHAEEDHEHVSLLGPVVLSVIYTVAYITVHVWVSVNTEALMKKGWMYAILSPISIGISTGLLTLSMAVAMREGVRHFGSAAPESLFKLFSIYIVGQTLILVAGHIEIYAPQLQSLQVIGGLVANLVGFLTLSLAITTLLVMEVYVSGVYNRLKHRSPGTATLQSGRARFLALLAGLSFLFLVGHEIIAQAIPDDTLGIKVVYVFVEIVIAVSTFLVTSGAFEASRANKRAHA